MSIRCSHNSFFFAGNIYDWDDKFFSEVLWQRMEIYWNLVLFCLRMVLAWRRMLTVSSEFISLVCLFWYATLYPNCYSFLMQPPFVREFSITSMKGGYRRLFQRPIDFQWYVWNVFTIFFTVLNRHHYFFCSSWVCLVLICFFCKEFCLVILKFFNLTPGSSWLTQMRVCL